ncbi:MAG: EAL and HDOD domain-containing protein, partial [Terriglobia bacterium]
VQADEQVFWACDDLKNAGYRIALDDFTASQNSHLLLPLADFIKVDFMQTTPAERRSFAERFIPRGIHLLAEKVENQEESESAIRMGYEYCQGYFFAKPKIITGRDIPSSKINLLRILREATRPDFDQERLVETLKHEASVCYRLLKYLNTFAFSFCREITSIRHGVTLLGEGNIRRWISLVAATAMGQDKPSELVLTCLARARCCELLAEAAGVPAYDTDLFLTGMLSTMDALLGRPLPSILEELRVCSHISLALTSGSGPLYPALRAVLAMESGDWGLISRAASEARISDDALSGACMSSLEWAQTVFRI